MNKSKKDDWASALNHDGYLVVQECDLNSAKQQLKQLGETVHNCIVQFKPNASTYLSNSYSIPPHTDHPFVKWIAWQCESQDLIDGSTLLFDSRELLRTLTVEQMDLISKVELPMPARMDSLILNKWYPMFDKKTLQFYYANWLIENAKIKGGVYKSIRPIKKVVDELVQKVKISIKLKPNEMLIIDNRRMLHFRDSIQENSIRKMHRFWLT